MKPGVILKLEHGEEPWTGDGEIPGSDSSGECLRTRPRGEGGSSVSAGYGSVSLKRALESSSQNLQPLMEIQNS